MVKRVRPSEAICQGEEDSVLLNDDATEANVQQSASTRACAPLRMLGVAAAIVTCVGGIVWVSHSPTKGRQYPSNGPVPTRSATNLRPPVSPKEQPASLAVESNGIQSDSFVMIKIRTYDGPRLDNNGTPPEVAPFLPPDEGELCERWAVVLLSPGFGPTRASTQLAAMSDWCIVAIGDRNGPTEHNVDGVTYLSPADQEALPYRIASLLPWDHLGRKSVGYIYAIHHGAKVIYDVDDDNILIHPENDVPYSNAPFTASKSMAAFAGGASPSTIIHNPYSCFGGPENGWPRGLPLNAIGNPDSSRCDVVVDEKGEVAREGQQEKLRPVGVVQSLANNEPDVDAVCRLALSSGERGRPYYFVGAGETTDADSDSRNGGLKIVPESSFTPYNAQATLHFLPAFWGMLLPVTVGDRVSDIWRSYFTQALLPATGAVIAFSSSRVTQVKAPQDFLSDFHAELPLYEQGATLVAFLADYRLQLKAADGASASSATTLPGLPHRIEALAVTMYEHGILGEQDVVLTRAWLNDLLSAGYTFEPPKTNAVKDEGGTTTPTASAMESSGQGHVASVGNDNLNPSKEETNIAAEALGAKDLAVTWGEEKFLSPGNSSDGGSAVPLPAEAQGAAEPSGVDLISQVAVPKEAGDKLEQQQQEDIGVDPKSQPVEEECKEMQVSLNIVPDQSWGKTDKVDRQRWESLGCNTALRLAADRSGPGEEGGDAGRGGTEANQNLQEQHLQQEAREHDQQEEQQERREGQRTKGEAQEETAVPPGEGRGSGERPFAVEVVEIGKEEHQMQQRHQEPETELPGASMLIPATVGKPHALLVIAVVSIRPDRRAAIRESWLAWADKRVVLRFFTEAPDKDQLDSQATATALAQESAAHGDLVVLDIDRGMNFALKLLSSMRYLTDRYTFDYFLRLDDDYFICLHRLLDELEAMQKTLTEITTKEGQAVHPSASPPMLYAGHRYCEQSATRIDEAYMLLSAALVQRVLSTPTLRCSAHAGISAGWWFTRGHKANRDGDVHWVHDPRLDHFGNWWKPVNKGGANHSAYASVCDKRMGVHHAYPERMAQLWAASKHASGLPQQGEGKQTAGSGLAVLGYIDDAKCSHVRDGVSPKRFDNDHVQPCESYHAIGGVHCGAQKC